MKLVAVALFALCLASTAGAAARAKPGKVIDVGDLEVKGEVRKPFIQYLDADQATKAALPTLVKKELTDFEARLLTPAKTTASTEVRHASH